MRPLPIINYWRRHDVVLVLVPWRESTNLEAYSKTRKPTPFTYRTSEGTHAGLGVGSIGVCMGGGCATVRGGRIRVTKKFCFCGPRWRGHTGSCASTTSTRTMVPVSRCVCQMELMTLYRKQPIGRPVHAPLSRCPPPRTHLLPAPCRESDLKTNLDSAGRVQCHR